MNQINSKRRKPPIIIGDHDLERLTRLASAAPVSASAIADELLAELDRARTRAQHAVPGNIVRMGSLVTFRTGDGTEKTVQLVYPNEADIEQGRVSVLTPIGTALIGLSEGQSIGWQDRFGKSHELAVVTVRQPQDADAVEEQA